MVKRSWNKIEADERIASTAVSEVPSEVSGILVEQLFGKDDLVQVGQNYSDY
jgi:2-oxoglutarate dehydrogenase E2 component (dihydrolipoamide succinyltransferase)